MGGKLSKDSSSDHEKPKAINSYDCKSTRGTSIIEFLKPECLKTKKTKKRRQFHQIEKNNATKVSKLTTLEDWLMTSPSLKEEHIQGGELCVLKHASKKVHPSNKAYEVSQPSKGRKSFSKEKQLVLDQLAADKKEFSASPRNVSTISRTQSGKTTKKVSFRLPEEADIIIFYSPQDSLESDEKEDCSL